MAPRDLARGRDVHHDRFPTSKASTTGEARTGNDPVPFRRKDRDTGRLRHAPVPMRILCCSAIPHLFRVNEDCDPSGLIFGKRERRKSR